ncbi:glycosyltransferase 52 family protein [Vibrio fortis]|uniref:Glycosyltransferase 52 family protein n=1 Tax=Vibrio fortis TaxID=212667 RepID=A0A5N3QZP8_9VIBR|nr:glycosyltransferase 52 family protein [Vibrio fortis]KAB0287450.1 glycosyltransferase 52 family protein [Vibrio fortis]
MNLFLVTSPFQYICAEEALNTYKTEDNILLLVNQASEPGITQERKLVTREKWQHIIEIPRTNRSEHVPKAIKKIKSILQGKTLEHFFHAEYSAWRTKLIIKNLPLKKEVYFDDGTLTINEYEELIRPRTPYYRPRFLQDIKIRFYGCQPIGKLKQSSNLELFTIFNIKDSDHKIVKNDLSILKERFTIRNLYNEAAPIGFIGQGAIGHKRRKTIEQYVSELEFFINNHGKEIIYFPHRTESEELKSRISQLKGVKYHYSSLPLEAELLAENIQLSGLVGITSTVQFTSKILFPEMPIYNLNSKNKVKALTEQNRLRQERIRDCFSALGISDITI